MQFYRIVLCLFTTIFPTLMFAAIDVESAVPKNPALNSPAPGSAVLRVYMMGNYLPLHGVRNQQRIGIEAEIAEALASAMGRRIKYFDRESLGTTAVEAVATGWLILHGMRSLRLRNGQNSLTLRTRSQKYLC